MTLRLDPANPEHRALMMRLVDSSTGRPLMEVALKDGATGARRQLAALDAHATQRADGELPHTTDDWAVVDSFWVTTNYPPSINECYADIPWVTRDGRHTTKRVLTKQGLAFKKHAARAAAQQGARLLTGKIRLVAHVFRPRRAGDVTNRIKLLEDSLQGVAYLNDSQVVDARLVRHLSRSNPRVEICVAEVSPVLT